MVFGREKTFHKKFNAVSRGYIGLAKDKFDVVSSQFSLHYYFKNEDTLRGFLDNLRYLCKDDGYFIGTCYDGHKLFTMFKDSGQDTIEMTDEFGSLVYQITKKYDMEAFDYTGEVDSMVGHEIDVYMSSIGQTITEYLVNFDFFISIMKEYGFEMNLPTFRKRKGTYNPIKKPIDSFETVINNYDEIKEKDGRFLRQNYFEATKIIQKDYRLLSGLNNYFVFQKVKHT